MQLSLNIKDEKILDKLLLMLQRFKSDEVQIIYPKEKGVTYKKLEALNQELEKNELLESIMLGMPKDYVYKPTEKSDKEIWYEEVKVKYE